MKRLLNFIIGKLFKIPLVNLDKCYPPENLETTSLNVKTLSSEVVIPRAEAFVVPGNVYKKEIARRLSYELIDHIEFETTDAFPFEGIRCRGSIRIVIDKEA